MTQKHSTQVHITVSVTRTEKPRGRLHLGVCSNYLADLTPGSKAAIFVRESSFRAPWDLKNVKGTPPVIMVENKMEPLPKLRPKTSYPPCTQLCSRDSIPIICSYQHHQQRRLTALPTLSVWGCSSSHSTTTRLLQQCNVEGMVTCVFQLNNAI